MQGWIVVILALLVPEYHARAYHLSTWSAWRISGCSSRLSLQRSVERWSGTTPRHLELKDLTHKDFPTIWEEQSKAVGG